MHAIYIHYMPPYLIITNWYLLTEKCIQTISLILIFCTHSPALTPTPTPSQENVLKIG